MVTRRRLRIVLLIANCAVYGWSLFVPCYYTTVYHNRSPALDPTFGIEALLFGWVEIFDEGYSAWLANPLLLIAWILILAGSCIWARFVAILALFVSLSFLLYETVLVNEAGSKSEIIRYGIGYWLWLSTFVVLCVATATMSSRDAKSVAHVESIAENTNVT